MKKLNSYLITLSFLLTIIANPALSDTKALSNEAVKKIVKEYVTSENQNQQFFFNTAIAILGTLIVVSGFGMIKLMLDEHRIRREAENILSKAKSELSEKIEKVETLHRKKIDQITRKYEESLIEELEGFRHRAILYPATVQFTDQEDSIFPAITYLENKGTIKDLSILRALMKNSALSDETKGRIEKAISSVSKRR